MAERAKVLIKEKIADSGVDKLREHFDVDVETEMTDEQLALCIADYDAIVIRSATKLTSDLIAKADNLKIVGRAGIGVDNVDLEAATKRGIMVANAPESNMVAAAEHAVALMLSVCRNIPQAHKSLTAGKWERSKFGGIEVFEKTLGILGFGRIGQLVAHRAKCFGMKVVAYDPYVAADRYREMGVSQAASVGEVLRQADIITLHLPKTAETANILNDETFSKMKDGVIIINAARGELIDHDALLRAIESGKVSGAGLDVFPEEPCTDLPLFEREEVVVTPHLGASTVEAQDRAGEITAEQIVLGLQGKHVPNAVNAPAKVDEVLVPFVNLSTQLGRLAVALVGKGSVDEIVVEFKGSIADHDTRYLMVSSLIGVFQDKVEESVNFVNALNVAEERGIRVEERKDTESGDFTNLVVVRAVSGERSVSVGGTTFGPRHLPHLVQVFGQSLNMEIEPNMAFFRYSDQPGMIGRVGTVLGDNGINIASTAVGREPDGGAVDEGEGLAVMVVTVDSPVSDQVMDKILALGGFKEGYSVST